VPQQKKQKRQVVDEQQPQALEKDFLLPAAATATPEESTVLRQELGIKVSSHLCSPPISGNDDPRLPGLFATFMWKKNLKAPSAIQRQCWPACLSGHDFVAVSATVRHTHCTCSHRLARRSLNLQGSGKTIAYLLPAVPHITAQQPVAEGPVALVSSSPLSRCIHPNLLLHGSH
jgi:ATP-dependent RNA helicase DDX5/DBP2